MSGVCARCHLEEAIEGDGSGGPPIVLVHSSVSGPKQWRRFLLAAGERYRGRRSVYVASLPGHGEAPGWPLEAPPGSLMDYAAPLADSLARINGPLHVVGHSMGGSAAMAAAALLGDQVSRLALFEPNLLFLLRESGRQAVWDEASHVFNELREKLALGDLTGAAEGFCGYWEGAGAWAAAPQARKEAYLAGMPPLRWELRVVMESVSPPDGWAVVLPEQLVLIAARDTPAPMKAIACALGALRPEWRVVEVARGGHLAPIIEPDLVNPVIFAAVD